MGAAKKDIRADGPKAVDGLEALAGGGYLTIPEAARFLNLSRSAIYNLMNAGELAYLKAGRSRRIPRKTVAEFIKRNTCAV